MAKTGATATPITPAGYRRARIIALPEHSVQTPAYKGQPARVSAGYVSACTGHMSSIKGFYRNAAQNGASDGAKTASLYVAESGVPFKATYLGTLSESSRGLAVNLSVNASGAPWLAYNTDSSSAAICKIEDWTSEWSAGDSNPVVIFTVYPTGIQGSGG